jgi:hypothetical protein
VNKAELDIFSGIRDPDPDHPEQWAAVGVDMTGSDAPQTILEAAAAVSFGARLIRVVGEHPDAGAFRPEILQLLPPGAGISGDDAAALGLQLIVSGLKAGCELAIWRALDRRGWTATDRDRFVGEVSDLVRKNFSDTIGE